MTQGQDMSAVDELPSIFDCREYTDRRWPPYHNCWSRLFHAMLPCVFSFAYTPKGRVSKYWCSLQFECPRPNPARIDRWEKYGRPRLRKGYRWSHVYAYSKYIK